MTISRSTQDCFNDSNTGQVISNPPGKLVSGGARSSMPPAPPPLPGAHASGSCVRAGLVERPRLISASTMEGSRTLHAGATRRSYSAGLIIRQKEPSSRRFEERSASSEQSAAPNAPMFVATPAGGRGLDEMRARACSRDWNDGIYVINHRLLIEVLVADPARAVR
jgi:hypothetical protein